jgi:hypothetical protein
VSVIPLRLKGSLRPATGTSPIGGTRTIPSTELEEAPAQAQMDEKELAGFHKMLHLPEGVGRLSGGNDLTKCQRPEGKEENVRT